MISTSYKIILIFIILLIVSCNSGVNQNPSVNSVEKDSDDLPGIESQVTSSNIDITTSSFAKTTSGFKTEQLTYSRVRTAYEEKAGFIKAFLKEKGYDSFENELFIRIFKEDEEVEVWLRPAAT